MWLIFTLFFTVGMLVGIWIARPRCPHRWKEWYHDLGERRRQCIHCKKVQWMFTAASYPKWHDGIPRKYGPLK